MNVRQVCQGRDSVLQEQGVFGCECPGRPAAWSQPGQPGKLPEPDQQNGRLVTKDTKVLDSLSNVLMESTGSSEMF